MTEAAQSEIRSRERSKVVREMSCLIRHIRCRGRHTRSTQRRERSEKGVEKGQKRGIPLKDRNAFFEAKSLARSQSHSACSAHFRNFKRLSCFLRERAEIAQPVDRPARGHLPFRGEGDSLYSFFFRTTLSLSLLSSISLLFSFLLSDWLLKTLLNRLLLVALTAVLLPFDHSETSLHHPTCFLPIPLLLQPKISPPLDSKDNRLLKLEKSRDS